MKVFDEELDTIAEYGKKLKSRMEELCISQDELARAAGVSQPTIGRILRGDNKKLPSADLERRIEAYLEEAAKYESYSHLDAPEFGERLDALIQEFGVPQEELSTVMGKTQADISRIMHGSIKTNVKEQWDALQYFYRLARKPYGTDESHEETADGLEALLYGPGGEMDDYFSPEDFEDFPKEEVFRLDGELLDYAATLPTRILEVICDHPLAFFEETEEQIEKCTLGTVMGTYGKRFHWMENYQELGFREREEFIADAEKNARDHFPEGKGEDAWHVFRTITDMRQVIEDDGFFSALREMDGEDAWDDEFAEYDFDGDGFDNEVGFMPHEHPKDKRIGKKESTRLEGKHRAKALKRLENLTRELGLIPGTTDALRRKLSFDRKDWYVWMLLLMNAND